MTGLFKRLWREEVGQDLVEYMLLAAFIGLASYGGFVALQNTIHSSYIGWDSSQQGIYAPPDCIGCGS